MLKRYCYILYLLLCFFTATAADKKPGKAVPQHIYKVIKTDSTKVVVHSFNARALKQYTADDDFVYKQSLEGMSFFQRFLVWLRHFFNSQTYAKTNYSFYKYLYIGLATTLVVIIILKFNQINMMGMFRRDAKKTDAVPYSESLENIHEIGFDDEIEKALSARNYRLAIRLLYLRSLKQLSDARLIHWQIEKTNNTYLTELTDADMRQSFGLLTTQFEYAWYGDFPVDQNSFEHIDVLFQNFKQKLP